MLAHTPAVVFIRSPKRGPTDGVTKLQRLKATRVSPKRGRSKLPMRLAIEVQSASLSTEDCEATPRLKELVEEAGTELPEVQEGAGALDRQKSAGRKQEPALYQKAKRCGRPASHAVGLRVGIARCFRVLAIKVPVFILEETLPAREESIYDRPRYAGNSTGFRLL